MRTVRGVTTLIAPPCEVKDRLSSAASPMVPPLSDVDLGALDRALRAAVDDGRRGAGDLHDRAVELDERGFELDADEPFDRHLPGDAERDRRARRGRKRSGGERGAREIQRERL